MSNEKRLWIIEARDGAWGANGICKGELVRCKECKHRGFHRALNCIGDVMTDFPENSKCPMKAALLIMPDDFYCKYSERKENRNELYLETLENHMQA